MQYYEKLKMLREEHEPKLTQEQLGAIFKLQQRQISYLETGRTQPDIRTLTAYCNYFNVSADYILGLPKNLPYPDM